MISSMQRIIDQDYSKVLGCPKCGESLLQRRLRSGVAHSCPTGSGSWLEQAAIDSVRQREIPTDGADLDDTPVGLFRSRRFLPS